MVEIGAERVACSCVLLRRLLRDSECQCVCVECVCVCVCVCVCMRVLARGRVGEYLCLQIFRAASDCDAPAMRHELADACLCICFQQIGMLSSPS